ncbi:unnamed protein product [Spirodela intermedia]|uniref:Uncharacterized protein n=1 Tax=Spirodela intermedia TaxID=51605 RepID=A0A7I8I8A1_SPIIN|nr:unnamed protein product [Spirodela intermedia]CAA6653718.1 unnamed protein product [Spirodela intermedia]
MVSLISACASLGALAHGMWLHTYLSRARELHLNHVVATALIAMYGRCGQLAMAEQVFDRMPLRDAPSYNAMIQALAVHGDAPRALRLFHGMAAAGVSPDGVTFLAAMTACAHAGLVDEGRRCFVAAAAAEEAAVEHYGCLVDLLGRAGLVEEAAEAVRKMPVRPNAAVYRALLAACGTYDDLPAGEAAATPLLRLEPRHGGNYVLLANLYASRERWGMWAG